jgi:hypothetical protein
MVNGIYFSGPRLFLVQEEMSATSIHHSPLTIYQPEADYER